MFESAKTLNQFLRNVSETTTLNGYFIGTSYDGNLIYNMLKKLKKERKHLLYIMIINYGKSLNNIPTPVLKMTIHA